MRFVNAKAQFAVGVVGVEAAEEERGRASRSRGKRVGAMSWRTSANTRPSVSCSSFMRGGGAEEGEVALGGRGPKELIHCTKASAVAVVSSSSFVIIGVLWSCESVGVRWLCGVGNANMGRMHDGTRKSSDYMRSEKVQGCS